MTPLPSPTWTRGTHICTHMHIMLFIDYSSAFNTIVPSKLVTKLRDLRLNNALCEWIHHTDSFTKAARQRLFLLRRLQRLNILKPVLRSKFNIPRVPFCYLASLKLTKAISLSGPTTLVINSLSQPRVSQSSHECVYIKGSVFATYDQSQTWTSLLAADWHILMTCSNSKFTVWVQQIICGSMPCVQ